MKKFFYAAMAVALAFANVACDDDDPADGGGGNEGGGDAAKKEILYSFTQKNYVLGESVELTVELLDRTDASAIVADEDIPVKLIVKEGSTAVKDDNFTIENETAIVRKGTNKCTFKLTSIPDDEVTGPAAQAEEEEESKIIVLGLQLDGANYIAGQFPEATVTMVGSMVNDLYGTWVMNELVTDKDFMVEANYEMVNFDNGFPVLDTNDKFVFDGNKLTTELSSDWKNYFQSESGFTFAGEMLLRVDNNFPPTTATVQLLELDNVNRFFSAADKSEDKTALIGVRNITGENGETLLDVYVIDYESHSFAPEFIDWSMYSEQKPVAAMAGTLINFTMKKAQ